MNHSEDLAKNIFFHTYGKPLFQKYFQKYNSMVYLNRERY